MNPRASSSLWQLDGESRHSRRARRSWLGDHSERCAGIFRQTHQSCVFFLDFMHKREISARRSPHSHILCAQARPELRERRPMTRNNHSIDTRLQHARRSPVPAGEPVSQGSFEHRRTSSRRRNLAPTSPATTRSGTTPAMAPRTLRALRRWLLTLKVSPRSLPSDQAWWRFRP